MQLDWTRIDSIFLDMDGTLLDLHYDNHFWLEHMPRRYAEYKALPLERGREELLELYRRVEGTLNWYCLDYWSETLGLDMAALSGEVAHLIAEQPHALEFLDSLRRCGKRVILLTNAHRKGIELKMNRTRLGERLDRVISSHDLGLPKEHADFWLALKELEPYTPEHSLLVDDSLPVLRAARAAGLGWLLAVRRPDTRQPPRQIHEFPAIGNFQELLPHV